MAGLAPEGMPEGMSTAVVSAVDWFPVDVIPVASLAVRIELQLVDQPRQKKTAEAWDGNQTLTW